jgi:hypothetical protein
MESLERLCVALTLDIQLIIEEAERMKKSKSKKKKKNLALYLMDLKPI